MAVIALAAAALILIAWVWAKLDEFFTTYPHAWRFASGNYMTKRHGREPIARRRRLRRAGIRTGTLTGLTGLGWAYTYHQQATIAGLAVAAAGIVAFLGWQVWRFRPVHHFRRVRPARRAVTAELGAPPDKFHVPRDLSEIYIGLPGDRVLDDKQQKALEYAATTRLAIAAEPVWRQHGPSPYVILRKVEPCPALIGWEAFEERAASAKPDKLIVGMGKDGKVIEVSLTQDSPHFALSMGSGAGKSNLTAFWLLQELRRGAVALILDAKWTSHPWVFKDMDSEYDQLPCVRYCRRTEDLHNAMVWLDGEVERRSQVSDVIMNAKGDMPAHLGTVGPRIWVIAEEMNLAYERLRDYWAEIRQKGQPARSPAFKGIGAVAQAGRSLDMHMVAIAQQLTAASIGGGAVRENLGVRCLARYQLNTWKMLCGDLPMPPSVMTPGRVQCVVGPSVDEAQTPLMDPEQVRDLVLAGDMTPVPDNMPGIASSILRNSVVPAGARSLVASDQGIVIQQAVLPPSRPPGTMTLQEAVEAGWWPTIGAARQARHRYKPQRVGTEDRADLYRVSDLAKCKNGSRR